MVESNQLLRKKDHDLINIYLNRIITIIYGDF